MILWCSGAEWVQRFSKYKILDICLFALDLLTNCKFPCMHIWRLKWMLLSRKSGYWLTSNPQRNLVLTWYFLCLSFVDHNFLHFSNHNSNLLFVYFSLVIFKKLNRDTWANETLSQTIRSNFLFWQVSIYILKILIFGNNKSSLKSSHFYIHP